MHLGFAAKSVPRAMEGPTKWLKQTSTIVFYRILLFTWFFGRCCVVECRYLNRLVPRSVAGKENF